MPSARPSSFITGTTTRDLPPASAGLRAPADVASRADRRLRHAHPVKTGPVSDEKRAEVVATTMALMDVETPTQIAIRTGTGTHARCIRDIIKQARLTLQERAVFYLDLHAQAATIAASEGDAKPAQWALERIAEGGDRIVDEPKSAPPPAPPQFNLGFVIGGIPMPSQQLIAAELPTVSAVPLPENGL